MAKAFSECYEFLGNIDPQSSSTELNSGWIGMANFERIIFIIQVGATASTATVDADIEQATNSSGANPKNVSGKSITQLTDADDDVMIVVEVEAVDLDRDNDYTHVQLELTCATAASLVSAVILGQGKGFKPVSTANLEEVIV